MTCQEFENLVDLLTGPETIDDVTRQRVLRHTLSCTHCAGRLSDEQMVSDGLGSLAAETERLEASPRVKAALMEAFAASYASEQTTPDVPSPENVVVFPARRRTIMTLAAAASIIALLALAWQLWLPAFSIGDTETIAEIQLPVPSPTVAPLVIDEREGLVAKAEPAKAPTRRATKRTVVKSEAVSEQADFIPLTLVSDTASVRSGTVVRVEVQRATLIAMGLPVNAARNDSLIKADLIVGDDGIARAIRFVQ
ncbi:MAG: hypothetical protein IPM66_02160 [Acidobacteriota bacterium]|nr:MAG: hypothetical protein IPM66_02160 [Acidobacteriota bacterium]